MTGNDLTRDTLPLVPTKRRAVVSSADGPKRGIQTKKGRTDDALSAVVDELEVLDIPLVQQDLRDGLFHVGRGFVW